MMLPPNGPAQMSGRLVGRVVESMRQTEDFDQGRYNQGVPPHPRDQRGDRHIQSIKVTADDSGHRYLWPAAIRYWSGYAAGVHTYTDWPDAGVRVIWATVAPGGDDLVPDGEYVAQFVGIHTDGKAVFEVAAGGGGATLTTGNVDDGGAEDSTTAILHFRESTGVRVDKGATDADPDIVSFTGIATQNIDGTQSGRTLDMRFDQATGVKITQGSTFDTVALVYGPTLNVVTNLCKSFDAYGVWNGFTVEKQLVIFPVGTTFGAKACVVNPTDCCVPGPWLCAGPCGATELPGRVCVNISGTCGGVTQTAVVTADFYTNSGGQSGWFVAYTTPGGRRVGGIIACDGGTFHFFGTSSCPGDPTVAYGYGFENQSTSVVSCDPLDVVITLVNYTLTVTDTPCLGGGTGGGGGVVSPACPPACAMSVFLDGGGLGWTRTVTTNPPETSGGVTTWLGPIPLGDTGGACNLHTVYVSCGSDGSVGFLGYNASGVLVVSVALTHSGTTWVGTVPAGGPCAGLSITVTPTCGEATIGAPTEV